MTRLSVNINKFATLRNARGGNLPDVQKAAEDCERFGAQGITVHPRSDERHIRYQDVVLLKPLVKTELNIEGYPSARFLDLIDMIKPEQVTLVPDSPKVLTSNQGWDTIQNRDLLKDVINRIKKTGARISIFTDPDLQMIEGAKAVGADRIELYTGPYAEEFSEDKHLALAPYQAAAKGAKELELGINAGHDLNLHNLPFLIGNIPFIDEVSIGHALICDAIYLGLENTIQLYLQALEPW